VALRAPDAPLPLAPSAESPHARTGCTTGLASKHDLRTKARLTGRRVSRPATSCVPR
jgi:hypothetical protein